MLSFQSYSYPELFDKSFDGMTFEVWKSPIDVYEGHKVVMKHDKDTDSVIMKAEGTYNDDGSETLVTPYGAITGASFKIVTKFEPIGLRDAFGILANAEDVYVKSKYGQFSRVTRRTDFDDLEAWNIETLLEREFYKKVEG
jgi:hypothetical protein